MIRVLQILVALNDGGIEKLLYDYYMKMDQSKVHFDFAINDINEGLLEKKFIQLGSRIFRYTKFKTNYKKAQEDINKIIRNGNYDIIHSHLANRGFQVVRFAKKFGCPMVISHSHSANQPEKLWKKTFRIITASITCKYSDFLFSCGEDAGQWMWRKHKYQIIHNAIKLEDYRYNSEIRNRLRAELHAQNKLVFLCVGRLSDQKNQIQLVEMFGKYIENNRNALLVLVGEGDKREEIQKIIYEKNLSQNIVLLGARTDVKDILMAADVFVLASKFEGLPISVIEAQCAGLTCILSDNITKEVCITPYVRFFKIYESYNEWDRVFDDAKGIIHTYDRNEAFEMVNMSNYDINIEAKKLEQFYLGDRKIL